MENASKALLIAGAILLAILIISLGLLAYRGASNTVNNNNMDATEKDAFNLKWSPYLGNNVNANTVNALLEIVQSHNQNELATGKKRYITVRVKENSTYAITTKTYGPADDTTTTLSATETVVSLPATTTYKVTVTKDGTTSGYSTSGLIRHIYIQAN